MVMKMPPVTISLSGRVPGRASEPPEMGSTMAAAAELFVDKLARVLRVFTTGGIYRREGRRRWAPEVGPPCPGAARGGRAWGW